MVSVYLLCKINTLLFVLGLFVLEGLLCHSPRRARTPTLCRTL